ncbi:MAG TPA: OmpA family protein [Cyclobacteriaceae bacterium]|nr:OmpA family protein [Cyclobacteriaceae bacterium]
MRALQLLFLVAVSFQAIAQPELGPFDLVNTPYDEQSPVISPDGKYFFFTVSNHPQNMGAKRDPGDIWFSVYDHGRWTAPVHAGPVLNDRAFNAVAGFSEDGSQLFLLSHYDGTGNAARTQGISVSRNNGSGWSKPENISIPYFLNKSTQQGHLASNGSVFVFSAETYGTHGVEDIYVSVKDQEGKWSEPRNLGTKINTQFQELCPSLSPDGTRLYFSSNGRKGFGSFDIYVANRLDDTWINWSEPVNMGRNVNSEYRELYFKAYPSLGFDIYTSTKDSDGYGDFKMFKSENPPPPDTVAAIAQVALVTQDTVVKIVEQQIPVMEDKFIRIHGKITNAKSGEIVDAALVFEAPDTSMQTKTATGEYQVRVSSTGSYSIKIDAPGYVSDLEKLDVNTYEMKELEMNFKLQPIELGTTVTLKNVLFMQSKPELLPESYPELDLVVQFLKANPHLEIELSGHTDSRGSFRQLMTLSQQRVNKVKSYLVSKGISSRRIEGKGYGGSKPIASNDSEETRMLNRRVEFTIKKL